MAPPPASTPGYLGGIPPSTELAAILSGLVGGGKYGLKIRVPHALVMTALFRRELSTKEKLRSILKLSFEHATNLAAFVTIYKTVLATLKWAAKCYRDNPQRSGSGESLLRTVGRMIIRVIVGGPQPLQLTRADPGLPERPRHSLIAGAIGGYLIWGRYSSVNYQIVMYLFSRIVVGGMSLAREKGIQPFSWEGLHFKRSYQIASAAVWAVVMVLFETHPHVLHPSLKRSMDEIYKTMHLPRFGSTAAPEPGASRPAIKSSVPSRLESATTIDFSIEDAGTA